MDIKEITILDYEQTFGEKQLGILEKYGISAEITDFSILLGGHVSFHTNKENSLKNCMGRWWVKTSDKDRTVYIVDTDGKRWWVFSNRSDIGIRPCLRYSTISSNSQNGARWKNRIFEIEFGEYPQTIVSENFSKTLEEAFANMSYSNTGMKTTGKNYTTDSVRYRYSCAPFQAKIHSEYEYNGGKYIRLMGNSNCIGKVLSDGRTIQDGTPYWVKIEPIKWIVDKKSKIALSEKILFSGTYFASKDEYDSDFKKTDIKKFIDEYFIKDIIPSKKIEIQEKNLNDIDVLLEKIGRYAKYSDDIETLEKHINMLIEEYNNDIEAFANNKLQLKLDSSSGYKQKLIINLQNILDNLKKLYDKKHTYEEIIEVLKKLKKIILGEKIESDESLITDFEKIYKALDYINNYNLDKEFVDLIDLEINKIENYLKNIYDKNKKIEFDDQKSFELYFRTKIHPLLTKIHINVVNRNVINEMTKIIKNEIDELNKNQKSSVIEFFLNEIKKEVAVIKNIDTNKNHEETLKHLLNIRYDKLGSEKTTLKVLTDILIKLYEIELDITNKQNIRNQKIMTKFKVLN